MKFKKVMLTTFLGMTLLVSAACSSSDDKNSATGVSAQGQKQAVQVQIPALDNTPIKDQYATFVTNQGTFKVRLFGSKTPITVKNFTYLIKNGYYNNLTFHRVIDQFMIQGGDPQGTGRGGPGYEIPDEIVPSLHFDKPGLLAMANRGPNTGGSQFFITLVPTQWLDSKHTIFGSVVQGMDVIEKIGKVKVDSNDKPKNPVVIEAITLEDIPEGTAAQ